MSHCPSHAPRYAILPHACGASEKQRTIQSCVTTIIQCTVNDTRLRGDGSWLDMAESELAVFSTQCLDRRIPDKMTLVREVAAWQNNRNKRHVKANWRFTTNDARVKLKSLYPQFL